jgi:DNA-binding transcriptional MerR regulator
VYIVELHFRGLGKALSRSPEERVIASIYRLSREDRNKLQYLKVKFYRLLDKHSLLRIGDKYIVPKGRLPEIERGFQEIRGEFVPLRAEIYSSLIQGWPQISARLRNYAEKFGIPPERVEGLKPSSPEDLLEMDYTLLPLSLVLGQAYVSADEFERMAEKAEEYRRVAERIRRETDRVLGEVREGYEEKLAELEGLVERLREALKKKSKETHRLRLRLGELAEEAGEVASLLGEETAEDLRERLEAVKGLLVEAHP